MVVVCQQARRRLLVETCSAPGFEHRLNGFVQNPVLVGAGVEGPASKDLGLKLFQLILGLLEQVVEGILFHICNLLSGLFTISVRTIADAWLHCQDQEVAKEYTWYRRLLSTYTLELPSQTQSHHYQMRRPVKSYYQVYVSKQNLRTQESDM